MILRFLALIFFATLATTAVAQTPDPAAPCAGARAEWRQLSASTDVAAVQTFLARAPNICVLLRAEVRARIAQLGAGTPTTPAARTGEVARDCAECPRLVAIPAGSFTMGGSAAEVADNPAEGPQRRVTIARGFAMAMYETSFDEWSVCVNEGGCAGYRPADQGWGEERRPVINVSHEDARAYAQWLSQRTGRAYRLPTEAEWEYAARAGASTAYSFGAGDSDICANANISDMSLARANNRPPIVACDDGFARGPAPAGSFRANRWGLFDMHGNVSEWVQDCWHPSYAGAPTGQSAWMSGECSERVVRGGSWFYAPVLTRSASREGVAAHIRGQTIGFRVVRDQ